MKKFLKILIVTILILPVFFVTPVLAADIDISIDLSFKVDSDGIMHIKEIRNIKNNSSKYYIKKDSEEIFLISTFKTRAETNKQDLEKISKTIVLSNQAGAILKPAIEIKDYQIEVKAPVGSHIKQNQEATFTLEYDNFSLVEKVGKVWNIYLPGMPKDHGKVETTSSGATTLTSYAVSLQIDGELGDPNFVLPKPAEIQTLEKSKIYTFDTSSLINKAAWAQIGDTQIYRFKIIQPVEIKSDLKSAIFNTWYDLLLPRKSDNQEVYFESFSPEPDYITEDGEGNVVARFKFSNHDVSDITVEGYIQTVATDTITKKDVGDISDIDLSQPYIEDEDISFEDLLASAQYWEVDAEAITKKADELKGEKQNVYEIVIADYTFITKSVDYDNLKLGINNERKGALSTLQGGSSVCMEYSDLLITLLRAQGIPARGAFGYGFDPKSETETEEGHQWVEVYMPYIGWVAVDPTWGDTGRRNYIGGDVDHALWYVAGENVEEPSPIVKYSVSAEGNLEPPKFEIQVVEQANLQSLTPLDDALARYPRTTTHKILERVEQLNTYGKILFLGIPAFLLLVLFAFVMSAVIRRVVKRMRLRKKSRIPNN